MNALTHIQLMAGYNMRLNNQVYRAAAQLDHASLAAPAGAYFDSVLGTLNHILVGDLLWLARFANHCEGYPSLQALSELPAPQSLDQLLYPHFGALGAVRRLVDEAIVSWSARELQSTDLNMPLAYRNRLGESAVRHFGELVLHLFNHQTHHRGQVSTLLSQKGVDIGSTDFLLDIPRLDTD
ncbi:DinB family protein [Gilvimarinus xylanilyticus]|uniref:Damage-inducible protein DinB n=1 Tax=Gilvimarinus xylanilyticus TaxID=2944139 RepID=A0A9X2I1L8_9GAMM|nr:DinB family protein [Gilvimarinus xylanilyticus]MCP8900466.1 damage-inducible protein DinB [Gilvimarinus xylanilyticus]